MNRQLNLLQSIEHDLVQRIHCFCEENKDVDHLQVTIHSLGGSVTDALCIYNDLKRLPCKITTHNLGEVTSAAVIVYLAGSVRTAESNSKFIIYPPRMAINGNLSVVDLQEAMNGLTIDVENYADVVNRETNSLNGRCDVRNALLGCGSIALNHDMAYECGIVTQR